jgi:catechol 2,3-dioxygenase-like lactoylglutathione lyase family enzyme
MLRRAFLAFALGFVALAGEQSGRIAAVDSIGMTVSDLDRSTGFYTNVLGFEKVSESEGAGDALEHLYGVFGLRIRTARLKLGDEHIELTQYLAPEGRPIPVDSRSNDRWFQHIAIIVSDMDRAYRRLREHKVRQASPGPQRLPDWNPNAGGIEAFYFRDPDGHALEILRFPAGKGDPRWQKNDRLFLGIDHTAIVISNTEASLRFYRDLLGLNVTGESENYGPEQERLNNVFGARLRITALRAPSGPGIEFLEYLSPGDGRPYPADAKPNDLLHWHTTLLGTSTGDTARTLRTQRSRFISSGIVEVPDADPETRHSMLVRDPDGHAIRIAGR